MTSVALMIKAKVWLKIKEQMVLIELGDSGQGGFIYRRADETTKKFGYSWL